MNAGGGGGCEGECDDGEGKDAEECGGEAGLTRGDLEPLAWLESNTSPAAAAAIGDAPASEPLWMCSDGMFAGMAPAEGWIRWRAEWKQKQKTSPIAPGS